MTVQHQLSQPIAEMESSDNETSGDEQTSGTEESSSENDDHDSVEVESARVPENKAGDAGENTDTLGNKEHISNMKLDDTHGPHDSIIPAESESEDGKKEKDIVMNKKGKSKRKFDSIGGSSDMMKPGNGEAKKKFERLFSEEDEVAILKGMIQMSLVSSSDELFVSIKDSLSVVVNSAQLADKVRKMRKRFLGWAAKGKVKKGFKFSDIQPEIYDLSEEIWKHNGNVQLRETNNLEKEALGTSAVALDNEVNSAYPHLLASFKVIVPQQPMDEFLTRKGLELLDPMVTRKLDERWKDIITSQMKNRLEMFELFQEQTKLLMDAIGLSPS